jgi:hypothetical protein
MDLSGAHMDDLDQPDLQAWVRTRNAEDAAQLDRMESWVRSPEGSELGRIGALFVREVVDGPDGEHHLLPVDASKAKALVTVLDQHPARETPRTFGVIVDAIGGDLVDTPWRRDAAELLMAATVALGTLSALETSRVETILHVAFGADGVSLLLRRVLTGRLERWDPTDPLRGLRDPLLWLDPRLDACLPGLLHAAAGAARYVSGLTAARAALVGATANGIDRLRPDRGSCGDVVAIEGSFPAAQSTGTAVYFPRAGGRCWPAEVRSWTATRIEVRVPEEVGDGPVGFVTGLDSGGPVAPLGVDVSSPIEFAGQLASCIGAAAGQVADRLATFAPRELLLETPCPPVLPGDANVFHGGPVLGALLPAAAGERDAQPVVATGRNLLATDTVEIDRVPVPTTFVDATQLQFRPVAIPAGRRVVRIRRGTCRSNFHYLDVRATLDPAPLPRVRPGDQVMISGTGFAKGQMSVHLNTEPVIAHVNSPYQLEFRSFRPRRVPPAPNRVGEAVTVEVFHAGSLVGSRQLTLDTFRIAIFGDSIAWGQGLSEPSKFTNLLADRFDRQFGGSIGVYALDRLAHSGAVVLPASGVLDAIPPTTPVGPIGEVPASTPSVSAQVAAWAATPALAAEAAQIDLVVLDGGINDVDVRTILNPLASDAALAAATRRACRGVMAGLLNAVRGTFLGATRIVVTGYYPIVSADSDLDLLVGLLTGMGLLAGVVSGGVPGLPVFGWGPLGAFLFKQWLVDRLTARSALFAATANTALAETIAGAGDSRVALAIPGFGPRNAIFAPDSFLFDVSIGGGRLSPTDPVAATRVPLCGGTLTCEIASIGHPNPAGANAYFDAINALL